MDTAYVGDDVAQHQATFRSFMRAGASVVALIVLALILLAIFLL